MTIRDSISAARVQGPIGEADGVIAFEFQFAPEDPTFAGHFPNRPLLPGVFQLEMARASAEWALGCSLSICEVVKAKFLRPIVPGEVVRLELRCTEKEGGIRTRIALSAGGRPAGEAVIIMRRAPR